MTDTSVKSAALAGAVRGAPFLLVIVPFGLLFGVVGSEAGLSVAQVMGFSVLVIAGASQFTALQLLQDNAPIFIVLATALAVNLRMAMYSAALAPHLGVAPLWQRGIISYLLVDQTYAVSYPHFEAHPQMRLTEKVAFILGMAAVVAPMWYASSWLGAVTGRAFPDGIGLDFAVPITFLALIAPALRTAPHVLAAVTSVALALALDAVPFSLGLIIAALAAMAVGALAEVWQERRAAR